VTGAVGLNGRRDSSLRQLSLRMTQGAAPVFSVILSAAKDLARKRVSAGRIKNER